MTSMQMYVLAQKAVAEHEHVQPDDETQPDVLWVGGVMENRRAIVWLGEKLYMVTYDTNTKTTNIDVYEKAEWK